MKHLILILIGLIFVGNALADAEIAAGDKLFGVLDQSLQSKKIKRPSNPTARQKYVNIFVTSSLIQQNSDTKKNIIDNSNPDNSHEQEVKSDIPITELVNEFANKDSQIENMDGVGGVNLGSMKTVLNDTIAVDTNHHSDFETQLLKLTPTRSNEISIGDSANGSMENVIPIFYEYDGKKNSEDSITLDSGYLIGNKADNYSYMLFAVEGQRAYNRLFEVINRKYLSDTSLLARLGYFLGSSFIVSTSINAIPTTYHEWGHFSRDRALGGTSSIIVSNDKSFNSGGDTTFFGSLKSYQKSIGGSAYVTFSDSNAYIGNSSGGKAVESIIYGAGLNNESALVENFDEEFFFNERPTLFNSLWQIKSRSGPSLYRNSGGDIDLAVSEYNSNGVTSSLTADKLRAANVYSLLSGSNISAMMAAYNYTNQGITSYKPLMWGDFLVPNQTNYFSTRGLTRKIQSGYAYAPNTKFVFGLEYVELGQSFTEYNFGVNHKWDTWQAYGKLTVSEKGYLNTEFNLSKKLTQNLKLGAYLAQWDSRSLLGERNSLKLSANTTNQGGLRISYLY